MRDVPVSSPAGVPGEQAADFGGQVKARAAGIGKPLVAGGERSECAKKHFEDMHVRVYGTVGIVNGIVVETGAGGIRKTLFTDVFAYRDGKWQAVSAQELPAAEEKVQSQIRNKPFNSSAQRADSGSTW